MRPVTSPVPPRSYAVSLLLPRALSVTKQTRTDLRPTNQGLTYKQSILIYEIYTLIRLTKYFNNIIFFFFVKYCKKIANGNFLLKKLLKLWQEIKQYNQFELYFPLVIDFKEIIKKHFLQLFQCCAEQQRLKACPDNCENRIILC